LKRCEWNLSSTEGNNHDKKIVISLLIALLVFGITISLYIRGQFKKPEFFVYDLQAKLLRADKVLDSTIKVILDVSSAGSGGEK
jgi:hypothetical protein